MTHSCKIGDVTSPARVRTRARKRVICIHVYAEAQIRRKYIPETLADESEPLFPDGETPLVFSKLSRFRGFPRKRGRERDLVAENASCSLARLRQGN
jgi:hypothetical protein